MLSTTYPGLAHPGSRRDHAGPSIPLEDLNHNTNLLKTKDSLELGASSSSDKGKRAIPLDDLRKAIKGIENLQDAPSKIHDFVATDDGIVSSAMTGLPDPFQLDRKSALKIMDKSETIEGLFCPCITYGKIKHELDIAERDRVGEVLGAEEDGFNACNGPCCGYAAVTILLLSNRVFEEFGGGILATKQTKAISIFYRLEALEGKVGGNKALNVVLHNATNIRNLAEVRIAEEVRKKLHVKELQKAQQYVSELPMEMKKRLPDQFPQLDLPDHLSHLDLPGQLPQLDLPRVLEDALEDGKPGGVSLVDRFKDLLASKASGQPEKAPEEGVPTIISPSQNLSAEVPLESKEDQKGKRSSLAAGDKKKANKDEQVRKPKTKSKSRNKKSQKAKGKQVDREIEAPVLEGAQPEDEAEKGTQEADGAQEGIPEIRLERGQSIVEIPANARVHSLSGDTFLIEKPANLPHDLDLDSIVPFDKARLSHILEHDQIIQLKPAPEDHRLSADALIPDTAAAPGHYLEGDPVVSGPRQLFSHELLNDPIVERAKAFLPHTLESDKKVAAAKAARAHSLAGDAIIPAQPTSAAHDLDSDTRIAASAPGGQEHDISRDVRILSPSGQVRPTHTIEADEIIRETAQFRKSPLPEPAASSSASEERPENNNNNLVASLNAVVDSADRALDELGRPAESDKENRAADAPPGRGFWGRMFPKRQGPDDAAAPDSKASTGDQPAAPKA